MTDLEIQRNRALRISLITAIKAKNYYPKNITKREAKTIFQNFTPVEKEFSVDFFESVDKRKQPRKIREEVKNKENVLLSISFPGETVGKLKGIFNTKSMNIIADTRVIFNDSLYAYSSNYKLIDERYNGSPHKEHPNIIAYHHFVNKIEVNNEKYYVRFTVHEERKLIGKLHSAHVSGVEIINEKSRGCIRSLPEKHRGGTEQPAYDYNLIEFFNSVK